MPQFLFVFYLGIWKLTYNLQAVAARWFSDLAWFSDRLSDRLDSWDTPAQYAARQPATPYDACIIISNAINSTGLDHGLP